MSSSVLGLLILVAGLIAALIQALMRESQIKKRLHRYDTLADREEYQQQLESNIHRLENQQESLNSEIRSLQQEFNQLGAKVYLQSIDYYEPKYEFISSNDYLLQLNTIKSKQKEMQKNNQAYICQTQWTVGDSKREGKKMVNNLLKLVEKAFENQCRYTYEKVKFNNIESLKKEINSSFDKYNKYLKSLQCQISREYLQLKLNELDLKYEFEDKKQQEKEREKEIRKENKEREAIEKARQKAEEAEEREIAHQQELELVKQEIEQIEQAESDKRKQLELKIQELERQVAADKLEKENALSESIKLKSGYIYIISNIGSFGKDIYRICRTYRSKEDEYIREMRPVVPFQFDVHFKIFSEDALDTLQRLHQVFSDKRVNLVNPNRQFFQVSIDEIEQAVKKIQKQSGVFLRIDESEKLPNASEYWQTRAMREKN